MTDLDVVVNAITAGAGAVASGVASAAARDAYQRLKAMVRPHLAGNDTALAELESPSPRPEVLRDHLAQAVDDPGLVEAARRFHPQQPGIKDARGSVIGSSGHFIVNNTFYDGVKPLPPTPAAT